jgi:alkanesulfonate monooxygenase SsuD/methylene tetrahydromethanopterin reductase-like flavin-dependent oxidoreductase (luciferase family)
MEFGLFMMPLHPPHRTYADSYDRDLSLIVKADQLGYTEVWIGEHITERWENAPAPELLIAKASGMTENIIFGTGVTLLAIHNPVDLAHRLAMLDHLCRGRFYWGIGTRAIPTDLELYGLDPSDRQGISERSAEVLEVVLKIWQNEGKFEHHGKYFDISAPELDPVKERGLYMKPFQTPHPPISAAATTIRSGSIRNAGVQGWIPMSSPTLSVPNLTGHWEEYESGATSAGRAANRSNWRIARDVLVAPTAQEAKERANEVLVRNYQVHQEPNRQPSLLAGAKTDPDLPDDAIDVEYLMDNIWIVGDPQECADQIRTVYGEVGGFGTLLTVTQDPDDHQWQHECLELLKNEVGPRIADLG